MLGGGLPPPSMAPVAAQSDRAVTGLRLARARSRVAGILKGEQAVPSRPEGRKREQSVLSQARGRITGRAGLLGGINVGAATVTGVASQVTHTSTTNLLIVYGFTLLSEVVAIVGVVRWERLRFEHEERLWKAQMAQMDLEKLVEALPPGSTMDSIFFEVDTTSQVDSANVRGGSPRGVKKPLMPEAPEETG